MRKGVQTHSLPSGQRPSVLHAAVLLGLGAWETESQTSLGLRRQKIHLRHLAMRTLRQRSDQTAVGYASPSVLQSTVLFGGGLCGTERWPKIDTRNRESQAVRRGVHLALSRPGSSNDEQARLRQGTPLCNGGTPGASVATRGERSPQEWESTGQPNRKPRIVGCFTSARSACNRPACLGARNHRSLRIRTASFDVGVIERDST